MESSIKSEQFATWAQDGIRSDVPQILCPAMTPGSQDKASQPNVQQQQQQSREPRSIPIEWLTLAPKNSVERRDQIDSLRYPRICLDDSGHIHPRFITDSAYKSGRVYDRLYRREVPRVVPFLEGIIRRYCYDVLLGHIRKRTMMDDLRGTSAGVSLEVSQDEWWVRYWVDMPFATCWVEDAEMDPSGSSGVGSDDEEM